MKLLKQINRFILFGVFLLAYILLFIYIFIFKNISPLELFSPSREYIRNANFIPFHTIYGYLANSQNWIISASNVWGNVLLFTPLGIYLQLLKKNKKIWISLLIVFCTTVFVELFQWIFAIGTVDIDDIILNCLGGFIGILVYRGLHAFWKNEEKVRATIVIAGLIVILIPVVLTIAYGLKWRIGWLV